MSSKARATRRRRARYAARGLPDPARLYELNCQRRLPKDHPSADKDGDTDTDTGENGVNRREPILTTPTLARRLYQYVGLTGVAQRIDEVLRSHPGEQPVLTTHMILTVMLLAIKLKGRYMRTVFCEILAGLDTAVAIEWGLLDPDTGEWAGTYNMVQRQTKRLETFLEEGALTPGGANINLQWLVNQFLAPSIPKGMARSITEIAVDATDYETNARTIDFTPQREVDAGRIPAGTVLKHNTKIQRTLDKDAGTDHRSKSSKHEAGPFNGYFLHPAVATRPIRKGKRHKSVTPHILAMALTPADEEAGPIGYQVATQAKRVAPKLKVIKTDQNYTRKNETFVRCLGEQGWEIVMNQSEDEQKRVRLITAGKRDTPLLVHCGTPLVIWTPPHRWSPPDDLTGAALQDWYNKRAKYQWVIIQHFANGTKKLICPQCAGRVMTTAKTHNPNRPNRTKDDPNQPIIAVPDTEYCCDGMLTFGIEQLDNHQRNAYGTTHWVTDYAGRNPVEGVNGMIKDDGGFDKESCRAFGLGAHTLAALMAAVIHNLKQTRRARSHKTNNDSTPAHHDHATPDTTAPAPHTHPGTPINQPEPHRVCRRCSEPHRVFRRVFYWLIGIQWGVTDARRSQLGFPAYRRARIR